jgi:hypothetical protein
VVGAGGELVGEVEVVQVRVRAGPLLRQVAHLLDRDPRLPGDLLGRGSPAQPLLQCQLRLLQLPQLVAHRPRHEVHRPHPVDDRATDPRHRERLEGEPAARVEPLDRVHQPQHPVGDQVVLVDRVREPGAHPAGDVLHQRGVLQHQPVAQSGLAAVLELLPDVQDGVVALGRGHESPPERKCGRWKATSALAGFSR